MCQHLVLFLAECIQGAGRAQCLYLVSRSWAFGWTLVWGRCEGSCCEHLCVSVYVNTFPFLWANSLGVGTVLHAKCMFNVL